MIFIVDDHDHNQGQFDYFFLPGGQSGGGGGEVKINLNKRVGVSRQIICIFYNCIPLFSGGWGGGDHNKFEQISKEGGKFIIFLRNC